MRTGESVIRYLSTWHWWSRDRLSRHLKWHAIFFCNFLWLVVFYTNETSFTGCTRQSPSIIRVARPLSVSRGLLILFSSISQNLPALPLCFLFQLPLILTNVTNHYVTNKHEVYAFEKLELQNRQTRYTGIVPCFSCRSRVWKQRGVNKSWIYLVEECKTPEHF